MNTISISRRKFSHLLAAGAAAAVVRPAISLARQPEHATGTAGIVRLSANENPYGPSLKAHQAMQNSFDVCCRYPNEANDVLIQGLAKLNGVSHDQIVLGDGSSEILKLGAETIANTPREMMILVDEAYFHYADSLDYESVIPLVKDHPNLIVARTFSKIYGMAGLRCGYCVAQPETIKRMHPFQMWDSVNVMALAAATASLDDIDQVSNGQRLNSEAKAFVTSALDKMGYKTIPSQANFIMFDCQRPVVPLIQALKQRNVHVGRLFPALQNYMRVTIGKKSEMEAFLSAFRQVVA